MRRSGAENGRDGFIATRVVVEIALLSSATQAQRQYLLVTANYWGFTLTDGALRMLVVLYFHQLGYAPLAIAMRMYR